MRRSALGSSRVGSRRVRAWIACTSSRTLREGQRRTGWPAVPHRPRGEHDDGRHAQMIERLAGRTPFAPARDLSKLRGVKIRVPRG